MEFHYIVNKAFKYGGKLLKPGMIWTPADGPHDQNIIDSGRYVRLEEVAAEPEAKPKTTRRRRSKANG